MEVYVRWMCPRVRVLGLQRAGSTHLADSPEFLKVTPAVRKHYGPAVQLA